jgi:hypothetical protein
VKEIRLALTAVDRLNKLAVEVEKKRGAAAPPCALPSMGKQFVDTHFISTGF